MNRTFTLFVTYLLLIAVLAACGGKSTPPEAQPTQVGGPAATQEQPQATAAPRATATKPADSPAPTEAPSPTEESVTLADREAGLKNLKSYRMKWGGKFTLTEGGKTETNSYESTQEVTTDPKAVHVTITVIGSEDAKPSVMDMYQVGDNVYYVSEEDGKTQCLAMSGSAMSQALDTIWNPSIWGQVQGARAAGRETVNGIPAKKYVYNERSVGAPGLQRLSGEVWLAVDGGYVVKEIVTWEGQGSAVGQDAGAIASGTWTMEVSDVNAVRLIAVPEGCSEPGGADLPVMADAEDKTLIGDMLTYKTASALEDVVRFYETEMTASGWAKEDDGITMEDFVQIRFTKDGQTAQLLITVSEGTTNVMISLTKD